MQTWRFDFVRRIAALNVNESWAYDATMNDGGGGIGGFPQAGDARFWPQLTGVKIAGAQARRPPRFEVYGLASAGEDRRRFQAADGNFIVTGERHAGADVVVPITGTTSFVAAIAPDFSNVEIDQQTIAPQEFRRALNEYRPFFTQGANFFNPVSLTGINAPATVIFYSPAIGPFDRGLKLEGTQGLQSFGALEAQGAGFDDMVFGYKHAMPNRAFAWSLDGVMTHHQAGNDTIDQRAGNDATWQAQVGGRNNNTGFVYALDYVREQGTFVTDKRLAYKTEDFVDVHQHNYEIYTGYRDLGPQYAPVLGFTANADLRGPQTYFDLNGTPAHGILKRVDLFMTADRFVDRSGAAHQADSNFNLDLQFRNGLHLSGGPYESSLRTYDSGLIGYPFYTGGVTRSYNFNGVNVRLERGHAGAVHRELLVGPVRRHVPPAVLLRDVARDRHALERRRRDRRDARAAVVRRPGERPVAAPHHGRRDDRREHELLGVAARHQRHGRFRAAGREPRRVAAPPLQERQRAVLQLRHAGGADDAAARRAQVRAAHGRRLGDLDQGGRVERRVSVVEPLQIRRAQFEMRGEQQRRDRRDAGECEDEHDDVGVGDPRAQRAFQRRSGDGMRQRRGR